MKRKLMIIGITILLVLTNFITSYATEIGTMLTAVPSKVKVGDTFTVTLSVTCSDGINGVVTTYSYDEEKLEYVGEGVVDIDNYAFGGNKEAKEIFVYCISTDSIKEANLYFLTFKVKEGVEPGSIAKVSVSQIELDSDAATDSEHIMEGQEVSVTIVADVTEGGEEQEPPTEGGEEQEPPTEGGEEQEPPTEGGEEQDPPTEGEEEQDPPTEGEEGQDPPTEGEEEQEPPTEGGEEQNPPVDDSKDETTSDDEIPKAGLNSMLMIGIVAIVIIAVVMFRKNQKYRDIK